ncbi:MAG: hypothetical protein NC191_00320, partial [Muribaculaceae bacterium]|nr:hypothetical protein [Muribaculaceae bacterium]
KNAINNIKTRKLTAINARNAVYERATQSYQEQLAPIKERIRYDENYVPNPSCNLTAQQRQATAEELNKIIGSESNIPADASIGRLQSAWKNKYLSMPISLKNQEGETAILNSFPRYEAGVMKNPQGQVYHRLNTGDFKYEPVYRQMHVENPEEFVRQFDDIDGIYAPGRRQSCAKTRYYGECWGPLESTQYGFAEWNPTYNVKFVIHPKGAISNAAEIGEGKYGDLEVLYSADSRFKILGRVKKTVTPEEIKANISGFKNEFADFEKYEIHLQEI